MKVILETEHARLAQRFINEPLERMGVLGFPASGQRTWPFCNPASQGTDSRLCEVQTSARGGKHVNENAFTPMTIPRNIPETKPATPRAGWLAPGVASLYLPIPTKMKT